MLKLHKKGVVILNTFDRIDFLLKERKLRQIDLTNHLGVPKTHYTDWKNGRTSSYNKYLSQIADFFGVSVDYLLGKESDQSQEDKNTITLRGRDGSYSKKTLTDEQIKMLQAMINSLPEAPDDL